jgi:hypothetical protein
VLPARSVFEGRERTAGRWKKAGIAVVATASAGGLTGRATRRLRECRGGRCAGAANGRAGVDEVRDDVVGRPDVSDELRAELSSLVTRGPQGVGPSSPSTALAARQKACGRSGCRDRLRAAAGCDDRWPSTRQAATSVRPPRRARRARMGRAGPRVGGRRRGSRPTVSAEIWRNLGRRWDTAHLDPPLMHTRSGSRKSPAPGVPRALRLRGYGALARRTHSADCSFSSSSSFRL